MTSKLALYQKAAKHLYQERLEDLSEDKPVKRELDDCYDDTLQLCLEEGLWKWALRAVKLTYDPSIDTSAFGGLGYGFTMPSDFVRIANINLSPYFTPNGELMDYDLVGPGKILYTDQSEFHLKYVSNGATFGLDLSLWPETYAEGVGYRLAANVSEELLKSASDRSGLDKNGDLWIAKAKIRDALDDRVKTPPTGQLVRSRFGRRPRSLRDFRYW